jgi:hypothetical protein
MKAMVKYHIPLWGMKAMVKYHIPLWGMKAMVEYHRLSVTIGHL